MDFTCTVCRKWWHIPNLEFKIYPKATLIEGTDIDESVLVINSLKDMKCIHIASTYFSQQVDLDEYMRRN